MKYLAGRDDEIRARLKMSLVPRLVSQLSGLSWLALSPRAVDVRGCASAHGSSATPVEIRHALRLVGPVCSGRAGIPQ